MQRWELLVRERQRIRRVVACLCLRQCPHQPSSWRGVGGRAWLVPWTALVLLLLGDWLIATARAALCRWPESPRETTARVAGWHGAVMALSPSMRPRQTSSRPLSSRAGPTPPRAKRLGEARWGERSGCRPSAQSVALHLPAVQITCKCQEVIIILQYWKGRKLTVDYIQ